jgi:hypothetical protein
MSPDSNGEMNSLGGCSNASDVSWEQLDESDAKIVKWVPDYVVTHCAGCNTGFGIVKRKHHCRYKPIKILFDIILFINCGL